jgi:hypothetical protein
MDDNQRFAVRLACLKKARRLHRFNHAATDSDELQLSAALVTFVFAGGDDASAARFAALDFLTGPKFGAAPDLALITAQAGAYAAFLTTGAMVSLGGDFAKEPPPDAGDGLLLDIRNLPQADAGESGGGLGIESALDPVGGGLDGGDEIGVVGHEESSVDAFGSAATVGEAGRIGNDPAGGGAP